VSSCDVSVKMKINSGTCSVVTRLLVVVRCCCGCGFFVVFFFFCTCPPWTSSQSSDQVCTVRCGRAASWCWDGEWFALALVDKVAAGNASDVVSAALPVDVPKGTLALTQLLVTSLSTVTVLPSVVVAVAAQIDNLRRRSLFTLAFISCSLLHAWSIVLRACASDTRIFCCVHKHGDSAVGGQATWFWGGEKGPGFGDVDSECLQCVAISNEGDNGIASIFRCHGG
jgi:hypothetical protein